jgi:hypothetical protein
MDRFNSNEEIEATPLSIAKDIIYSDGTMDEKVKQIESAITEAKNFVISVVSKRHLLESILEDMDGIHPEYHYEVVKSHLDDSC